MESIQQLLQFLRQRRTQAETKITEALDRLAKQNRAIARNDIQRRDVEQIIEIATQTIQVRLQQSRSTDREDNKYVKL